MNKEEAIGALQFPVFNSIYKAKNWAKDDPELEQSAKLLEEAWEYIKENLK